MHRRRNVVEMARYIHTHKDKQREAIELVLQEIRRELPQEDLKIRIQAVLKLTYIHTMFSCEMDWASQYIIQILNSPQVSFSDKRTACFAARYIFSSSPSLPLSSSASSPPPTLDFHSAPVQQLLPSLHLMLNSSLPSEANAAMNCMVSLCTTISTQDTKSNGNTMTNETLIRSITPDIMNLINYTPSLAVKKRAILSFYRMYILTPDLMYTIFRELLCEFLRNHEQSRIVAVAVNVLGQLVEDEDPRRWIDMMPLVVDQMLTRTFNNWAIIKLLKMFQRWIVPHSRLLWDVDDKELQEPEGRSISRMDPRTAAMLQRPTLVVKVYVLLFYNVKDSAAALLYELVRTCLRTGLWRHHSRLDMLCTQKVSTFIESPDPNMFYLGLKLFQLLLSSKRWEEEEQKKEEILADEDIQDDKEGGERKEKDVEEEKRRGRQTRRAEWNPKRDALLGEYGRHVVRGIGRKMIAQFTERRVAAKKQIMRNEKKEEREGIYRAKRVNTREHLAEEEGNEVRHEHAGGCFVLGDEVHDLVMDVLSDKVVIENSGGVDLKKLVLRLIEMVNLKWKEMKAKQRQNARELEDEEPWSGEWVGLEGERVAKWLGLCCRAEFKQLEEDMDREWVGGIVRVGEEGKTKKGKEQQTDWQVPRGSIQ